MAKAETSSTVGRQPAAADELDGTPVFKLNPSTPPSLYRARRKGAPLVSTYSVQPGARVLWCLRRRKSDVRCILKSNGMPVEVQVLQERDVVLTEIFQEEWIAENWARAYADRLRQQGWQDSPESAVAGPQ